MARRKKWESGNVVEIELTDGSFSYGLIINEPLFAFVGDTFLKRPEISPKLFNTIAFQLLVMNSAIGKNGWPVIGDVQLKEISIPKAKFYRYDIISKKFFHHLDSFNCLPSTRKGCVGLECAAVWEKNHVEDRLQSLKEGLECKWEVSLRAESQA